MTIYYLYQRTIFYESLLVFKVIKIIFFNRSHSSITEGIFLEIFIWIFDSQYVEPVFYSILVNRLFLAYYLTRKIISFLSKIDGTRHCLKWKEYAVINSNNSLGKSSLWTSLWLIYKKNIHWKEKEEVEIGSPRAGKPLRALVNGNDTGEAQ